MAIPKGYHRTKDGRIAKKGLYYYMNQAKKKGTKCFTLYFTVFC